jgi:hypothetical protein
VIKELKPYIVGRRGYFGFCQTPVCSQSSKRGFVEDCVCIFGGNGEPGKTASQILPPSRRYLDGLLVQPVRATRGSNRRMTQRWLRMSVGAPGIAKARRPGHD